MSALPAVMPDNPGPWANPSLVLANAAIASESIGIAGGVSQELESLVVIDSTGLARAATFLSVASGQTTFVAPAALAAGPAVLVATGTDGTVSYGSATVAAVAPALFAALPSGQNIELYGTGIRGRSSPGAVTCAIGGVEVPVLYAGPQGGYPGLDQVNVLRSPVAGDGQIVVVLTVDGVRSNPLPIQIP
jgi:hypothetical protein